MTKQVETATVVANITLAGTATAIITGAYISGSPVTVTFNVLLADDSNAVALAARTAIALNSAVSDQYQVSGATDKIILTDRQARANDSTLNIATANGGCTGITAAPASANTTAGTGVTNAYATLAEFKVYASVRGGTTPTDANDDNAIEIILNKASRYIDNQTGRRFWANTADETRYYTAESQDKLFVDDMSAAPTSVACDQDNDRTYSTTLASTDYDLEPDNALVYSQPYSYLEINPASSEYFPTIRKGVRIIGKFGWPAVPDAIKAACLAIALNVYQSRTGQSSAGNISVTAAGVVIRPADVSDADKQILDSYRALV